MHAWVQKKFIYLDFKRTQNLQLFTSFSANSTANSTANFLPWSEEIAESGRSIFSSLLIYFTNIFCKQKCKENADEDDNKNHVLFTTYGHRYSRMSRDSKMALAISTAITFKIAEFTFLQEI